MNLGILLSDSFDGSYISSLDKICPNIWDVPASVRFYNINTESNDSKEIKNWCDMYFGCKFVIDSPRKSGRTDNINNSPKLSRTSSSSPRNMASPRNVASPRKLSTISTNAIQELALNCTHILILGSNDNLSTIVKYFPHHKLIILCNV